MHTLSAPHRPIYDIANSIVHDWKQPHFAACPYLDAMFELESIDDFYGLDPAREIILYFLSNAGSWRGPAAKAIKAELKMMLKPRR